MIRKNTVYFPEYHSLIDLYEGEEPFLCEAQTQQIHIIYMNFLSSQATDVLQWMKHRYLW